MPGFDNRAAAFTEYNTRLHTCSGMRTWTPPFPSPQKFLLTTSVHKSQDEEDVDRAVGLNCSRFAFFECTYNFYIHINTPDICLNLHPNP